MLNKVTIFSILVLAILIAYLGLEINSIVWAEANNIAVPNNPLYYILTTLITVAIGNLLVDLAMRIHRLA